MRKHRAFTLTEVLVAVAVMSIMAGVMALNSSTVGQQTAKREAERVAAFIQGHISRANIAMRGVWFNVNEDNIFVEYGFAYFSKERQYPDFKANTGCKYSVHKLFYNIESQKTLDDAKSYGWSLISKDSTVVTDSGTNGQHCIQIEGADKKYSNVIIGRK